MREDAHLTKRRRQVARPVGPHRTVAQRVNVCGMVSVTVRVMPQPEALFPPPPAAHPPAATWRPAPGTPISPATSAQSNAPMPMPCPNELEPGSVRPRQVCRRLGADSELGIVNEKVDVEVDRRSGGGASARTEPDVGDGAPSHPLTPPALNPPVTARVVAPLFAPPHAELESPDSASASALILSAPSVDSEIGIMPPWSEMSECCWQGRWMLLMWIWIRECAD